MPVLTDFHVLAQALLYFASVACGLVISIPLGVTQSNFDGHCLLYSKCNWINATYFLVSYQSPGICSFPVYVSVIVGILYAVGMCAYYVYAVTRKDPNIGSQMWVLPFTLINSLVTVVFFVVACVISVGFKVFCDSFAKGDYLKSCANAEKAKWNDLSYNGRTLYTYISASQVAAWAMFLIWLVQTALGFLRIIGNRRLRSQGMYADSNIQGTAAGGLGSRPKAEDMVSVVAAEPTA